jgi:hypothetical protein
MTIQNDQTLDIQDTKRSTLNERLETIGWSLFLILIGIIWIIPAEQEPEGGWLIGIGLIMLGLNAARYFKGLNISGFTTFLGLGAFIFGMIDFYGADFQIIPIAIILIGASIILKPLLEKGQA